MCGNGGNILFAILISMYTKLYIIIKGLRFFQCFSILDCCFFTPILYTNLSTFCTRARYSILVSFCRYSSFVCLLFTFLIFVMPFFWPNETCVILNLTFRQKYKKSLPLKNL
uniref:Uncharacterized protein n=1 Tax=Cacopsylla melanoneura TaxID=428564 RepID=A0A8D8TQG2_9HEMI